MRRYAIQSSLDSINFDTSNDFDSFLDALRNAHQFSLDAYIDDYQLPAIRVLDTHTDTVMFTIDRTGLFS